MGGKRMLLSLEIGASLSFWQFCRQCDTQSFPLTTIPREHERTRLSGFQLLHLAFVRGMFGERMLLVETGHGIAWPSLANVCHTRG